MLLRLAQLHRQKRLKKYILRKFFKHLLVEKESRLFGPRGKPQFPALWRENIETDLGISEHLFEMVAKETQQDMEKAREGKSYTTTTIPPLLRLWTFFYWVRKYPAYDTVAIIIHVSSSTVSREIHYLLPLVLKHLNFIQFPQRYNFVELTCQLAIDCSIHRRNRVFPSQHVLFR